jgi:alpha-galactosidase
MGKAGPNALRNPYRFLYQVMCTKPRLPKQPVYGINDWYVVYGKNSYQTIKEQTAAMAELVTDTNNRPFSVIDDGWQQADDFSIVNDKFKDMHKMADESKKPWYASRFMDTPLNCP